MKVFIYGLTDNQNRIRYIGQSVNPHYRYQQHLQDVTGTPKSEWIQSVIKAGGVPGLVVLDKVGKVDADYQEKWWITLGVKRGWQLTNVANPTRKAISFQDMFLETLKNELLQFHAEHDPVIFVTRRHAKQAAQALHILLGIVIGIFIGWHTYAFEMALTSLPLIAICYAIACFAIVSHLNFLWAIGEFRKNARKNVTLSAVALVQVLTTVVVGLFAAGG